MASQRMHKRGIESQVYAFRPQCVGMKGSEPSIADRAICAGLQYDPRHERDSCGMGFVAHVRGERANAVEIPR